MSKKMMKRSLALGALMAFVITGSAMAGSVEIDGETCYVGGAPYVYEIHQGNIPFDELKDASYESALENDTYKHVIGGNYLGVTKGGYYEHVYAGEEVGFSVDTITTVINSGVTVTGMLNGGNRLAVGGWEGWIIKPDTKVTFNTVKTDMTIQDGTIGAANRFVVAGDFIKDSGYSSKSFVEVESKIDSTNLNITGGNIEGTVVGGSYGEAYAGQNMSIDTEVKETNVTISGGNFREAIIAGGAVVMNANAQPEHDGELGQKNVSSVETANLKITGGEFKKDIYSGGFVGYGNGVSTEKKVETLVEKAVVEIKDVKINNFYAANAVADWDGNEWVYRRNVDNSTVNTDLTLTNVTAGTVDIQEGSLTLNAEGEGAKVNIGTLNVDKDNVTVKVQANGALNDKYNGNAKAMYEAVFAIKDGDGNDAEYNAEGVIGEGKLLGKVTFDIEDGKVVVGSIKEGLNTGNASVNSMANIALMSWRAETNDMNKRMGELRNANGEHGVWVRAVGGEAEYKSVEYDYNQYQLGYDEKLSTDPSWTVGVALSYTDAESSFAQGSGENEHKGVSVYGSKLNADGSFIDLIAKYSRLEHDVTLKGEKGDYSTNGYSVSAEYGKRYDQGNGLWIEPQVELTYGKVKSADYKLGDVSVNQDAMESLIGRIGFSIGKDIKQGNVYARASYLYDFEGETATTFSYNGINRTFEDDLGEDWWEVGVGANINLSKATYIYADVEKTFGGEVDTNWQWNLGVRYSF